MFHSTGKSVSRSTINFITSYHRREIINDFDFIDIFQDQYLSDLSSAEFIMHYCRSNQYNFQLLLNDPTFSSDPISETYTNDRKLSTLIPPKKQIMRKDHYSPYVQKIPMVNYLYFFVYSCQINSRGKTTLRIHLNIHDC